VNRDESRSRTWGFPRQLLEDHLALALMLWAGFVVVVAGITLGIAWLGTVTGSVWEPATSVVPWYVAFMSGYVLFQVMPLYISHGRTRHDTAIEMVVFVVIFAATAALLVCLGFLLERGFYAIAGWPLDFSDDRLFSSHLDLLPMLIENLLVMLTWAASGALVGAAVYRSPDTGWLSLAPAALFVSLSGGFSAGFMGVLARIIPAFDASSLPLATVVSLSGFLVALWLTWYIVRDVPLRSK
jgi:hypothetical protein